MEKGGWRSTFWVCHSAIHGQTRFSLACCPPSSWIWVRPHSHAKNKGCLGCPKLFDPATKTADLTPVWLPIASLKFGEFNHSIKFPSIPRGFTYTSIPNYITAVCIIPWTAQFYFRVSRAQSHSQTEDAPGPLLPFPYWFHALAAFPFPLKSTKLIIKL